MRRRHASAGWSRLYALPVWILGIAGFVFIYLPIFVVILYSFHDDKILSFPFEGPTLAWYGKLWADEQLALAFRNSLEVAVVSIAIGLVVGIPGAFGLDRYRFPGKAAFQAALYLPFVMPGILFGIALLVFFVNIGLVLSLTTVIVGHATLMIVVVLVVVSLGLQRWDRTIEQAAMDLGANEVSTFFLVILPNMVSSILGAILLGFTLSLDEVVRTFFWTGTQNRLPLYVWSMMGSGIWPEINAVATLIFVVSATIVILWSTLRRWK